MRILIVTQTIDKDDQILGFFHHWVEKMSLKFSDVHVICLYLGNNDLPKNVSVHSLGKEAGVSRFKYVSRFFLYIWKFRKEYDVVFVHMNQEYILLGGLFWKMFGKKIFFWRNHPNGSILTRISILLSEKVFCAAKDSFSAKFKKTILMPAGIDTDLFKIDESILRNKNSICMVGRISPIKNIDLCLKAISILINRGVQVSLTILGPCDRRDKLYLGTLKDYVLKNNLSPYIKFLDGLNQRDLPKIYNSHEIFVNLTDSGSFDKTMAESCACGNLLLVSNKSLFEVLPDICITENVPEKIAQSLEILLRPENKMKIEDKLKIFADEHSLDKLLEKLYAEIRI